MQGQRRGALGSSRPAAEPKAPANRRELDLNRERLIYCLTSLVGHKATAKCRNNVIYEGVFHSCSLDGDFSITLKSARQVGNHQGGKSGEVIRTLIIPGKDFLQVSASDIPSPAGLRALTEPRGFATDGEIALARKGPGPEGRELVAWQPAEGDELSVAPVGAGGSGLGHVRDMEHWDQFAQNERLYGVSSTFNEELYTTKLDPSSIPREKREEAERIAREIETGRQHTEVENCIDGEDDEELRFSAIGGTGAYRPRKDYQMVTGGSSASGGKGSGRSDRGAAMEQGLVPQHDLGGALPLTKEHLSQHEALSGTAGDSYAREHRAKRGLITAHSPMRSPMISEMKRINALNLEPALPKLDDKTRNDWINFKQSQTRTSSKSAQGLALKNELQQSLELFQKREASKAAAAVAVGASADDGAGGGASASGAVTAPAAVSAEGDASRSKFSFNPGAKEFSFNPGAATFTPTGAMTSSGPTGHIQAKAPAQQQAQQSAATTGPEFVAPRPHPEILRMSLITLLDPFLSICGGERTEAASSQWPNSIGPSFREVLGQPNPAVQLPSLAAMAAAGCAGATGPGPWQPGPQTGGCGPMQQGGGPVTAGPGGGPQVIPQGAFIMTGGPQQGQMGYPQMFHAGPRPPGGQGGAGPSGPQGTIAAGPKFGPQMVPVMVPAGQFVPQGAFVPQQGQLMQQGQTMQGQMMQHGAFIMQRGGQMSGPGSGARQVGGHEG